MKALESPAAAAVPVPTLRDALSAVRPTLECIFSVPNVPNMNIGCRSEERGKTGPDPPSDGDECFLLMAEILS
jgi:hypothetical protein